jgi:ABC-2 type transport system ATP-binding protein
METIIKVSDLCKSYDSGFEALKGINLNIHAGEIFALLGPNGAGKTTLISTVCGIVSPTSGSVKVSGYDIVKDYRRTRELIGLVPQELTLGAFDTVWNTLQFSRGLFGKSPNPAYLEKTLRDLSLFDKRDQILMSLSGGMKRRVLIAKALAHEPRILFLDEPTAGVDVELRKDMWKLVANMRESGVTIILTTHYIEEAEEIADRIGVINKGEILLVDKKSDLIKKMGKKQLVIDLREPISEIPSALSQYNLEIANDGRSLVYLYDVKQDRTGITTLLIELREQGLLLKDIKTEESSLEDIFVELVRR